MAERAGRPAGDPTEVPGEPLLSAADAGSDHGTSASAAAEREWWDDPRMPWKGKPGRQDLLCWAGFSLTGIYSLVFLPLRPLLLVSHPLLLSGLTGSRTAVVTLGALAAVGRTDWWWLGLILATVSVMKFDPLFWWAGRLWGRGLIDVIAGRSRRAARNADRAERLARRWGVPAMLLTYVVPVVPTAVVYATVGTAGMRLRTFLLVDLAGAFATRVLYMFLGYQVGQPAVRVLDAVARYAGWASLALLAVALVGIWRRPRARGPLPGS